MVDFSRGTQITVWTNDRRGRFAVLTNQPLDAIAQTIAVGDVNNDSKMDLVTVT